VVDVRALTYYVGVSLDGYIAAPDGSFDFFPVEQAVLDFIAAEYPETLPSHVRAHLGVTGPGTRFDAVVMGRATYAPALEVGITSPYAHLRQYVVSTTLPASADPQVAVVSDPLALVRRLKQENGAGIWLAGGGRLAGALLDEIDELVIKRYPVVVGTGIPAIAANRASALPFTVTDERTLTGGTTVTTYTRVRA
jgi:dihydrofolate reductase